MPSSDPSAAAAQPTDNPAKPAAHPALPKQLFDPATGALRRDRHSLLPRKDYASVPSDEDLGRALGAKFSRQLERTAAYVATPIALLQIFLLPGLHRQGLGYLVGGLILIALADLYAVSITFNASTKGLLDDIGFFPRNRLFLASWVSSCLLLSPLFWQRPEFMSVVGIALLGLCGAMILWQVLAPFVLLWCLYQMDQRPMTDGERFATHRYLLDRESLGYGRETGIPEIAKCAAAVLVARFTHLGFLFAISLGLIAFAKAGPASSLAVMVTPFVWLIASACDFAARGGEERPDFVLPDPEEQRT